MTTTKVKDAESELFDKLFGGREAMRVPMIVGPYGAFEWDDFSKLGGNNIQKLLNLLQREETSKTWIYSHNRKSRKEIKTNFLQEMAAMLEKYERDRLAAEEGLRDGQQTIKQVRRGARILERIQANNPEPKPFLPSDRPKGMFAAGSKAIAYIGGEWDSKYHKVVKGEWVEVTIQPNDPRDGLTVRAEIQLHNNASLHDGFGLSAGNSSAFLLTLEDFEWLRKGVENEQDFIAVWCHNDFHLRQNPHLLLDYIEHLKTGEMAKPLNG